MNKLNGVFFNETCLVLIDSMIALELEKLPIEKLSVYAVDLYQDVVSVAQDPHLTMLQLIRHCGYSWLLAYFSLLL